MTEDELRGWEQTVGDYRAARDALAAALRDMQAERQDVLNCINLYGDETLHSALDAIGFFPRGPS